MITKKNPKAESNLLNEDVAPSLKLIQAYNLKLIEIEKKQMEIISKMMMHNLSVFLIDGNQNLLNNLLTKSGNKIENLKQQIDSIKKILNASMKLVEISTFSNQKEENVNNGLEKQLEIFKELLNESALIYNLNLDLLLQQNEILAEVFIPNLEKSRFDHFLLSYFDFSEKLLSTYSQSVKTFEADNENIFKKLYEQIGMGVNFQYKSWTENFMFKSRIIENKDEQGTAPDLFNDHIYRKNGKLKNENSLQ